MAEKLQQQQQQKTIDKNKGEETIISNKNTKSTDIYMENKQNSQIQTQNVSPAITRERSFIRPSSNQQNLNKRRSLAFNMQAASGPSAGGSSGSHLRGKPTIEIYRPPKLHYNIQHSASSPFVFPASTAPQIPYFTATLATKPLLAERQGGSAAGTLLSLGPLTVGPGARHHHLSSPQQQHHPHPMLSAVSPRSILVTHPVHLTSTQLMAASAFSPPQPVPLMNSASSGNILHHTNRVKFAPEPPKNVTSSYYKTNNVAPHQYANQGSHNKNYSNSKQPLQQTTSGELSGVSGSFVGSTSLQRSKSLSSADTLVHGIAGLGLGVGSSELNDIGEFSEEVQKLIELAIKDPNQLNSRNLMELTTQFIKRSIEGRRYALPIARLCLNIIAKEQKETFLEALLNTCRQWYQEREKLLFTYQGMKSPSRVHFTAFMAFLTEMFCQLKRRQLQLHTQSEGAPPPLILLTLLAKCCEDCVRPPVRSLSEIECLFYVLTCIGQDLEVQLPQQLELLLAMIRDAFLNASDAAPAIRRILLQLIEMHACHWQLPGNTVLYYYPSSK